MSYPNIFEFQEDFEQEGSLLLGKGTFGEVYKFRTRRVINANLERNLKDVVPFPGQQMAVKMMNAGSEKSFQRIQQEFLILRSLPVVHPNIVTLYKCYAWANQLTKTYTLALAMELAERNLQQEINQREGRLFEDHELFRIFQQCIETLAEILQVNKILHRDIKPENLLLKGDQIKITDFGVSRKLLKERLTIIPGTLVGTPAYLSPKLWDAFANGQFQVTKVNKIMHNLEKSDIYSLGITLLQTTLLLPQEEIGILNKGNAGEKKSEELVNLVQNQKIKQILQRMIVHDEKQRANYQELLEYVRDPIIKQIEQKRDRKQIFKMVEPVLIKECIIDFYYIIQSESQDITIIG